MVHNESVLKTKKYTDDMLAWLRGRGKIIIIVHDNPDPDCLASALVLRHLFAMKLNKEAVITFSGMIARGENLLMAKELQIPLTPFGIVNLKEYPVVCMLDTQPGTGNNSLPPETRVDIIIDHHPLRALSELSKWVDVRDNYGSTATILYEYLLAQEVTIGTKLATALFYAIKSETQDLGREANKPDRDAYLSLFPLSNKKLLYEITHPKLAKEYFLTVNTAVNQANIYNHLLTVNLGNIMFPEIVAEMADFLLRLEKVETALCMGHYANEMIISIRTSRHDLNAGEIVKRLVLGLGTAGGHGMMAGGKIENVPPDRKSILSIEKILIERLLAEFNMAKVKSHKIAE